MSEESHLTSLFNVGTTAENVPPPAQELPGELLPEPTVEEVRAADAVFTQEQEQESHLVAGMLGIWTGAQFLHAVAVDTFEETEENDQPRSKEKKKGRPEEPKGEPA